MPGDLGPLPRSNQEEAVHSRHESGHAAGEHRLTVLELGCLAHALDNEAVAVKKCVHWAAQCRSEDSRMLLLSQAGVHRRHFDQLLELLLSEQDPQEASTRILGTT